MASLMTNVSELISATMDKYSNYFMDKNSNYFIPSHNGVPPVFIPCLKILKNVCDLLQNIEIGAATTLFQDLPTKQLEFLLEFVVFYFEVGTDILKVFLRRMFPENNELSQLKRLFSILYKTIDIYRSDIHILAFLYLTYLGPSQYFDILPINTLECPDETKKLYIRKHILSSLKTRTISPQCRGVIRTVGHNKSSDDFLIFCYNNNKSFDIFYQISLIDNILSHGDVANKIISVRTSKAVIESFLYSQLNVYQLLACLNVNDEYFLVNTMYKTADAFIVNRIAKLVKKHPQLPSIINSNMHLYKRAFVVFCCFLSSALNVASHKIQKTKPWCLYKNKLLAAASVIAHEMINKKNVDFILENCLTNDVNKYTFCTIFRESIVPIFLSNKTIDDSFIFEMLYNGNYEKTFYSLPIQNMSRRLYLCSTKRKNTSYVWYNIAKKHNHHNKISNVEINGLVSQNVIRPNISISHFLFKFGINKHHKLPFKEEGGEFGIFLQTLDKLFCKSRNNRNRSFKFFSLQPI